jgi:hypothetical protein
LDLLDEAGITTDTTSEPAPAATPADPDQDDDDQDTPPARVFAIKDAR